MSITPGHAKWLQDLVREWYHARKAWLEYRGPGDSDESERLLNDWERTGDALAKAFEEIGP